MNGTGKEGNNGVKVCVTGASGFIASWIVKLLLERGYTVNGTVRDPDDVSKVGHLLELQGAKERLKLFKANLLKEGDFDFPISGCHAVFHAASPVIFTINDPQVDVLDPAIKGTLNVLTSCKKRPSVRRVVLTSSMAAVVYASMNRGPEVVMDETWFSDPNSCKNLNSWYALSKTLAEDVAWKFTKDNGIDMVCVNPGMVIGTMLQPTLNASVALIFNLLNGAKTYPNMTYGWVNVKDVANAHILALENPSANGRYCLVESVAHHSEIVKILHELYPNIALPDKCEGDGPFAPTYQVSQEKVKSLGVEYTPLKSSLIETVENLKAKGFVSFGYSTGGDI